MKLRRLHVLVILLGLVLGLVPFRAKLWSAASPLVSVEGNKSVSARVAEFGAGVHHRLGARFHELRVAYPPKRIALVGLKQERVLEVWVADEGGEFLPLKTYPILGASGTLGPKLREGDGQVPEGLYCIESLNPNSHYHLALRVNYPNSFDQAKGKLDGRVHLGGDIMIHGGSASVGCLAIGNQAAEELFVLAAEAGIEHISLILSPVDFRARDLPVNPPVAPPWKAELYAQIRDELGKLKRQQTALPMAAPPPR